MRTKVNFTESQLRERYIDVELQEKERTKISEAEQWLNAEVPNALIMEQLPFDLELINRLKADTQGIYTVMQEYAENYLKQIKGFIPDTERSRIYTQFAGVADRLADLNKQICFRLAEIKIPLIKKGSKIIFDPTKVEDYVSSIGVITHTPEQIEYVKMLNKAAKMLVEIQHFEVDHNLPSFALESVKTGNGAQGSFNVPFGLAHAVTYGGDFGARFE